MYISSIRTWLASCVTIVCVRAQFQLSFGTATPPPPVTPRPTLPGGIDPQCHDKIDNCRSYGADACQGEFRQWALDNCEATCNFCTPPPTTPPPCEDTISNCASFEVTTCQATEFRAWAEQNCRKYCRLCSAEQLAYIDAHTTLPPTISPDQCKDKVDCRMYGDDVCNVSKYGSWVEENCPLYCKICQGAATPPPVCVDRVPDCALYQSDLCTNSAFDYFVQDNCRRFCNRCGVPTPAPPCVDYQPNCASYGYGVCTNPFYEIWAEDHCSKYCGFCGNNTIPPNYTDNNPTINPAGQPTTGMMTPPPINTPPPGKRDVESLI